MPREKSSSSTSVAFCSLQDAEVMENIPEGGRGVRRHTWKETCPVFLRSLVNVEKSIAVMFWWQVRFGLICSFDYIYMCVCLCRCVCVCEFSLVLSTYPSANNLRILDIDGNNCDNVQEHSFIIYLYQSDAFARARGRETKRKRIEFDLRRRSCEQVKVVDWIQFRRTMLHCLLK